MKKIGLYSICLLLVLAMVGCACNRQTTTGPENPNFTIVIDDASTKNALAYFQANTGYVPTIVTVDDETYAKFEQDRKDNGLSTERADILKAMTEGATCLLLKDAALIDEYAALGFAADNEELKTRFAGYRIDNADLLGLTLVLMPVEAEINADALMNLAVWMTGAEAKHLADNPDLLK